jgi:hypothetical protein
MSDIMNSNEVKAAALRAEIENLLHECTDAQKLGLHRIHDNAPWKGFVNCPPEKLSETYELVRRTVMGNRADMRGRP